MCGGNSRIDKVQIEFYAFVFIYSMPIMSIYTKFPFPFSDIFAIASSPFEYPLDSFKAAFEYISLINTPPFIFSPSYSLDGLGES